MHLPRPSRLLTFALALGAVAASFAAQAASAAPPFRVSDLRPAVVAPAAPLVVAPPAEVAAPDAVGVPAPAGSRNSDRAGIRLPVSAPAGTLLSPTPAPITTPGESGAPRTASPQASGSGPFGIGVPPSAGSPRFGTAAVPDDMLYVVADADDPVYRGAIAAFTGGLVDYFDARVGTPAAGVLAAYDCVYVHPNSAFADRVLLGDRLAAYVDAGGKVILGVACTYDPGGGTLLGGAIMGAAYSPVIGPVLTFAFDAYVGDGVTSYHAGILAYDSSFRDDVALQGTGVADGHYGDGQICVAYRADGKVIFTAGTGHASFAAGGQWPKLIANACMLDDPAAGSILYALAGADDAVYRSDIAALTGGIVDYFDASAGTPTAALLMTYSCAYAHSGAPFFDPVLLGDRLADFVDAGKKVILGIGCNFAGFAMGGRIMTAPYSPATSPAAAMRFGPVTAYLGDGTSPLHAGVAFYDGFFREFLVVQGAGHVDGHFTDGELSHAIRPDGRVIYSNGTGAAGYGVASNDWPRLIANACMLDLSSGHKILYAPSEADDPAYRAAIAAETGGIVDYFDAVAGTPSAALLASYDCVYTWANFPYADNVLFGDRLADYVDAGGKVVLGVFCTYTVGNFLSGRIMTPGYCPVVSPAGTNHFAVSAYAGDGTTCLHHRVTAYDSFFRDFLAPQGGGLVDGHYFDGEIAHAYRADRRVVYSNGGAPAQLVPVGGGQWARMIANSCECTLAGRDLLASNRDGVLYRVDVVSGAGGFIGNLPTFPGDGATEIEFISDTGESWVQARDGLFYAQPFWHGNAAPLGPPVPNGASYTGLEYALGRLWGTTVGVGCGASSFGTLDPASGVGVAVGPTGLHPIPGLAFDGPRSTMYGITSACLTGLSDLYAIDVTTGAAVPVAPLPVRCGSLQFGPDGDLYAGGDFTDGGNFYRINPTTGAVALVGNPGFGSITGLTLVSEGAVAVGPPTTGELSLAAPYPNPSAGRGVRFEFTLPKAGTASLGLYDVAGRLVWNRDMGSLPAGPHGAEWNGLDGAGRRAPPGVYFVRLRTSVGEKRVSLVRLD